MLTAFNIQHSPLNIQHFAFPRFLWPTLRLLAITLVLLFLFAQYVRRTGMFFPERYPLGDWDTSALAIKPQDVQFTTDDGVKLHSWLFRAAERQAPLVIWFHGNGGNITERAPAAIGLAQRGLSVLLFDWRGYGRSAGSPSEGALYHDAVAAYDAMHREDVILYGDSLGGPYAAYVATKRKARCVVIENSFPSLAALGNEVYRPLPLGWTAPRALATVRWLNEAGLPVLVMHSRADEVIPFRLGQRLYDQLRVPKEMLVSQTAGHGGIPSTEGARYYDAVTAFVKRHC